MKGLVAHKKNPNFEVSDGVIYLDDYTMVATVEINLHEVNRFLDEVYEVTNHIFGNWLENEGVTPMTEKARSTSVGDIVWIGNDIYEVDSFGWKAVNGIWRK